MKNFYTLAIIGAATIIFMHNVPLIQAQTSSAQAPRTSNGSQDVPTISPQSNSEVPETSNQKVSKGDVSAPDLSVVNDADISGEVSNPNIAVVADVGLVDLNLKVEGNVLTGSFSLISRMGRQNDIVYGIIFLDENEKALSGTNLGEVSLLDEGQILNKVVDFVLPVLPTQTGPVTLKLVAETKNGLPLSSKVIAQIIPPSSEKKVPTCASEVGVSNKIVCIYSADFNGELVFKRSLISNVEIARTPINITGGSSSEFNVPDSVKGNYYGILLDQKQDTMSVFGGKSDTTYAKFRNVVVYESNGLLVVTAPLAFILDTKPTIAYSLKGADDTICLEGTEELSTSVFSRSFEKIPGCETGMIKLSLFDQGTILLDEYSNTYSVSKYGTESDTIKDNPNLNINTYTDTDSVHSKFSLLIIFSIILVLLLVLLTLVGYRRRDKVDKSISNI